MAKKNNRKRGRAPLLILFLILILLGLLLVSFRGNNVKLSKDEKILIVGKRNLFAVYEDKLSVKIPFELNINSRETVKDLVDTKNYENILEKINDIMPEKLQRCVPMNTTNLKLDVENEKNIPETNIDNKRYILTSSVYSMFNDLYAKKQTDSEANENILVDVLNANGKAGYARRTGEHIQKELGMKFNAANYEKLQEASFVILNDISKEKAQEVLDKLPENYFKIKNKSTIPTLANLVVVLGKETKVDFKIDISSDEKVGKEALETLKKLGYSGITLEKPKTEINDSVIEYNKEDYFIAKKISKALNIQNMIETDSLNNKIKVIVK